VVIAAGCDLVSLIGGSRHDWAHTWFRSGSHALIAGTTALLVAAIAGFADRARHTDPGGRERAAVNRHAAVMSLMGVACIADLILRNGHDGSAQHTPAVVLALTLLALALATVGGELGGRLVYRAGIGVQRPATRRSGETPATAAEPSDRPRTTTRAAS
jgi:uncharacterized membrane protein